jgi:predicted kinase
VTDDPPGRLPVLLIGGPPGAGKSTVAGLLAARRTRCVRLEMDDIRQFVVSGSEAPWRGPEGAAQDSLAVAQAGRLAEHYLSAGFDVVVTDVLLPAAAATWLAAEHPPLIVWLDVSLAEARHRARTRPVHLTWAEFDHLHRQVEPPAGAHVVDSAGRSVDDVADIVADIWAATSTNP